MYLITVDEAIKKLESGGNLPLSAMAQLVEHSEGFGDEFLRRTAKMYFSEAPGNVYETPLAQILGLVSLECESYIPTVEKLIEEDRIEPFLTAILSHLMLPASLLRTLMPYAARTHSDIFLSHDMTLTPELLDLFTEEYVRNVFESDESFKKWVDTMGFDHLYELSMKNDDISDESRAKFQQLMLLWRSA